MNGAGSVGCLVLKEETCDPMKSVNTFVVVVRREVKYGLSIAGMLQLKEEVEALYLLCIIRVSADTIFSPFSTLDVNSGKGYKLWVQRDVENAILDGTTCVVRHPLERRASVRASAMSSWSCVWWMCLALGD